MNYYWYDITAGINSYRGMCRPLAYLIISPGVYCQQPAHSFPICQMSDPLMYSSKDTAKAILLTAVFGNVHVARKALTIIEKKKNIYWIH